MERFFSETQTIIIGQFFVWDENQRNSAHIVEKSKPTQLENEDGVQRKIDRVCPQGNEQWRLGVQEAL